MFFWDEDAKRLQEVNDAVLSIRNNINKILSEPENELVQALPRDLINDISRVISFQEVWESNMHEILERLSIFEESFRTLCFLLDKKEKPKKPKKSVRKKPKEKQM